MNTTHFATLIFSQAEKYGNRTALRYRRNGENKWREMSWKKFASRIETIAKALVELGVAESDPVGQFSQNMPENLIVDFALYANRAVMVPIYATSSAAQVSYIVDDAKLKILFVGEQQQYDVATKVLETSETLQHIIALDKNIVFSEKEHSMYFSDLLAMGEASQQQDVVEARQAEASESDMAAILYTPGTTGTPKGVILMHSGFNQAMRIHDIRLTTLTDKDRSIAFLPLSHVFERMWCYFCLHRGIEITLNMHPTEIQQTIKEIRPTVMCAVPRFWEKVYIGIKENLSQYSEFMLGVVMWAIAVGRKYNIEHLRVGKKPNWWLRARYKFADKFIFSKVKNTVGIENGVLFPTAGAALADHITVFFRSIGIPICYGYGLTESYATVSCFDYTGYEIGSVGSIMPEVEVRIGEDNEIQLRGKTVFQGYYNKPEITQQSFTEDGFFKTGDAGYIKGNHLDLTERIKDLFKTSNGKYIAPQQIETLLTTDKYIEQVAVIGDQRNYVTAIIVPNLALLEKYAKENSIGYANTDELLNNPQIHQMIEEHILKLQAKMAHFEVIKKFTLIKKGFTIETGELTNTLKLRRAIIMQKYAQIIDSMYEQPDKADLLK